MFKVRSGLWWAVGALAVVAGLMAPGAGAADRLIVDLEEPFEVNGQIVAAGRLAIQEVRVYSPVATLHKVSVDGTGLGLVLARRTEGRNSDLDQVIFSRSAAGHLVLDSIAVAGQPPRDVFSYRDSSSGGRWSAASEPVAVDVPWYAANLR